MAKNRHAQILGRKGGKKKSERKARAARLNGRLGGPKKYDQMTPQELLQEAENICAERFGDVPRTIDAPPAHDPRTCRLYRCGLCRALGHRDRNRGLL